MTNTAATVLPMPFTETDLADITETAEMANGFYRVVTSARLTRSGALLLVSTDAAKGRVVPLLEAAGYTAREVAPGRIAVTGAVDRLTLLRAERDRLNAEINRLSGDQTVG
ncbi:hypothetical protein SAMN05421803_11773 [Nocardiopsis flavescens]|uniref:Uncharacterized protein n=1 Tax=Nocardiopsis flavescens TaxID=758803 RepID=A0A1M6RED4_9ACTN|nr:hypothetical protein [Nocardiopsis flavescens]SHK30845.1 hypothetical protein SAMN05421803_11773 [Nocardiopsis flavescens]